MPRTTRLIQIMQVLRDGRLHRADDLAQTLNVTARTIYRDMERLMESGAPITGKRGIGYQAQPTTPLPPLNLTNGELEALHLGLAIVAQSNDPDLRNAAQSLGSKLDAALPQETVADEQLWAIEQYAFADAAVGFSHMPTLRAALRTKQKLRITYHSKGDRITSRIIRPLKIEQIARVWILTAWCETQSDFREFRTDLILSAQALPEMFVDEPGKMLRDHPHFWR